MRTLIILVLIIHVAICGKQFRLGRSRNGNLGIPAGIEEHPAPPASWFEQRIDHNNPSNLRTWKQRYYVNDKFYNGNNKIFLMIGGEGPINAKWNNQGAWIEYAQKFKALCFQLEHRYYGESYPTPDLSVKNMQYLSSMQALEDIAYFISAMNKQYKLDDQVKWVVFGGSYSGSLAAWARAKYPHLIEAAVSSSGPLLAQVDFKEYFETVVASLWEKTGSTDCIQEVMNAHKQIEVLMKSNPKEIEDEFKVCFPFSKATKNDIKNFYSNIADDFAGLVQYNEDNRIGAEDQFQNLTINSVCDMLTVRGSTPSYKKLAKFNTMMLQKSNETCMDYSYKNMIKELSNVTKSEDSAGRAWMWQTCTEFGFYQTSGKEIKVFGNYFTLDFFIQQCEEVFGKKYNEMFVNRAVEWTNSKYGGLDLEATNIIYIHGSIDPWHVLGMRESKILESPALYIHGTAHCADMYPSSSRDSIELAQARIQIQEHLVMWIGLP